MLIQGYKNRLKITQVLSAFLSSNAETYERLQVVENAGLASDGPLTEIIGGEDHAMAEYLKGLISYTLGRKRVQELRGSQAQRFIDLAYEV